MDETQLRRVKAINYGEQRLEALGQRPYLDFECKDGTVVRMPHPLRLDDEALARFEAFQRGDGLDREPVLDDNGRPKRDPRTGKPLTEIADPPMVNGKPAEPYSVRLMKAVLGETDYAKLRQHGLTASELSQIWQDLGVSATEPTEDDDPKER